MTTSDRKAGAMRTDRVGAEDEVLAQEALRDMGVHRSEGGAMRAQTDKDAERIIDRRVWARLAADAAYRNAEEAEAQAAREDEITRQEEERFYGGAAS